MGLDLSSESAGQWTREEAIGPYLRALRRHWIVVIAVTLIAAAMASWTVFRGGDTYKASAFVLVTPLAQGAQGDPIFVGLGAILNSGDPARDMQTAAALVDSQAAAAVVAQQLGGSWNAAGIQGVVSLAPVGSSDVLAVTATAPTPEDAARIANLYAAAGVGRRAAIVQHHIAAEVNELQARLGALPASNGASTNSQTQDLVARIDQLKALQQAGGDPTLAVSEQATPPGSPSGAPHWLIVLLSLLGGFAVGSVAALALEFFSRRVRDEEEVISIYPAPVLAMVPLVPSSRRSGLPPWSLTPAAFEQIRLLRIQLDVPSAPVIMVGSASAGDGKTTVAAALAAACAEAGMDTILIDLDVRKPDVARVLELEARRREGEPMTPEEMLSTVPKLPGVKVLRPARHHDVASFESLMRRLPELLEQAQRVAQCIIVDTPPLGEVSEALRVAQVCDQVILVVRPRHTDRRKLKLTRDLLERSGAPVEGLVLVGVQPAGSSVEAYGYPFYGPQTAPEVTNGKAADGGISASAGSAAAPKR